MSEKSRRLNVNLSAQTYAALQRYADLEETSTSEVVRRAIKKEIRDNPIDDLRDLIRKTYALCDDICEGRPVNLFTFTNELDRLEAKFRGQS